MSRPWAGQPSLPLTKAVEPRTASRLLQNLQCRAREAYFENLPICVPLRFCRPRAGGAGRLRQVAPAARLQWRGRMNRSRCRWCRQAQPHCSDRRAKVAPNHGSHRRRTMQATTPRRRRQAKELSQRASSCSSSRLRHPPTPARRDEPTEPVLVSYPRAQAMESGRMRSVHEHPRTTARREKCLHTLFLHVTQSQRMRRHFLWPCLTAVWRAGNGSELVSILEVDSHCAASILAGIEKAEPQTSPLRRETIGSWTAHSVPPCRMNVCWICSALDCGPRAGTGSATMGKSIRHDPYPTRSSEAP